MPVAKMGGTFGNDIPDPQDALKFDITPDEIADTVGDDGLPVPPVGVPAVDEKLSDTPLGFVASTPKPAKPTAKAVADGLADEADKPNFWDFVNAAAEGFNGREGAYSKRQGAKSAAKSAAIAAEKAQERLLALKAVEQGYALEMLDATTFADLKKLGVQISSNESMQLKNLLSTEGIAAARNKLDELLADKGIDEAKRYQIVQNLFSKEMAVYTTEATKEVESFRAANAKDLAKMGFESAKDLENLRIASAEAMQDKDIIAEKDAAKRAAKLQVKLVNLGIDAKVAEMYAQHTWQSDENRKAEAQEIVMENLSTANQAILKNAEYDNDYKIAKLNNDVAAAMQAAGIAATDSIEDKKNKLAIALADKKINADVAAVIVEQKWKTGERIGAQDAAASEAEKGRAHQLKMSELTYEQAKLLNADKAKADKELAGMNIDANILMKDKDIEAAATAADKANIFVEKMAAQGYSRELAKMIAEQTWKTSERIGAQDYGLVMNDLSFTQKQILDNAGYKSQEKITELNNAANAIIQTKGIQAAKDATTQQNLFTEKMTKLGYKEAAVRMMAEQIWKTGERIGAESADLNKMTYGAKLTEDAAAADDKRTTARMAIAQGYAKENQLSAQQSDQLIAAMDIASKEGIEKARDKLTRDGWTVEDARAALSHDRVKELKAIDNQNLIDRDQVLHGFDVEMAGITAKSAEKLATMNIDAGVAEQIRQIASTEGIDAAGRALTKALADQRITADMTESDKQRIYQTAEREAGQVFTSGENRAAQAATKVLADAGIKSAMDLQTASLAVTVDEKAKDRILTQDLAKADNDLQRELTKLGIKSAEDMQATAITAQSVLQTALADKTIDANATAAEKQYQYAKALAAQGIDAKVADKIAEYAFITSERVATEASDKEAAERQNKFTKDMAVELQANGFKQADAEALALRTWTAMENEKNRKLTASEGVLNRASAEAIADKVGKFTGQMPNGATPAQMSAWVMANPDLFGVAPAAPATGAPATPAAPSTGALPVFTGLVDKVVPKTPAVKPASGKGH